MNLDRFVTIQHNISLLVFSFYYFSDVIKVFLFRENDFEICLKASQRYYHYPNFLCKRKRNMQLKHEKHTKTDQVPCTEQDIMIYIYIYYIMIIIILLLVTYGHVLKFSDAIRFKNYLWRNWCPLYLLILAKKKSQ